MRQIRRRRLPMEPLEPRRLLSAALPRVVDLALDEQLDFPGAPNTSVSADGTVYFSVPSRTRDTVGLWKADAAGNTAFVRSFSGRSTDPVVSNVSPGGGPSAFFTVTSSSLSQYEIWRTDGTDAGTRKVAPASGTYSASRPRVPFVRLGGNTYFVAGNVLSRVSDASPYTATTVTGSTGASSPTVMNGGLYFLSGSSGQEGLYRVNDAGTAATLVVSARSAFGLVNVNGTLYFIGNDPATSATKLYKSTGTAAGSQAVAPLDVSNGSPPKLVGVGDTVYFVAYTTATGYELWKSDGTAAGTAMVTDLYPGSVDSRADNMIAYDGRLYFSATNGSQSGRYLWTTDGTAQGTRLVGDLDGERTSIVLETSVVGGTLYFAARTTAGGSELWRSDGTAAGTRLVSDRYPGHGGSRPHEFLDVDGTLYYQGIDPVLGYGLFKSDGTAAGTSVVKDYLPGPFDPSYINPWYANTGDGRLFYVDGDTTGAGRELWVTDGTAGGTRMVTDLFPGVVGSAPSYLTNVNGTIYFSAESATAVGRELWKTDGTAAGTVLVKDIHSNDRTIFSTFGSDPHDLENVNGTLYFAADGDGQPGWELWKSDGTPEGTVVVKIGSIASNPNPDNLTNVNGTLFFTSGNSLLKLAPGDTFAETLKTFNTLSGSPAIRSLRDVDGVLYFSADDGSHGTELWKSNGTGPGTVMVKDIRTVARLNDVSSRPDGFVGLGSWVIFYADDGVTGRELWRTDGTAAGTVLLKDIYPNQYSDSSFNGSNASPYLSLGGYVYFSAGDVDHGGELWRTDGTPAGTTLVKDIRPGPASSLPRWVQLVGGRIYFQADDGVTGTELWTTDGTEAGTIRVADINPGAGASTPTRFFDVNGAILIQASDGVNPVSLFRFEPDTVKPTAGTPSISAYGNRQAVKVTFDEDVSGSLAPADLVLTNLTTGQTIDPAAIALAYDDGHNVANFTFPGLPGGMLPDGNYHLSIAANVVRDTSNNPLAAGVSFDFYVLAADANHDRVVNFDDLLTLAKNYNKTGMTFDGGDFNYDGVVNFDDLLMLAKSYNKVLELPPPPPAPAPVVASVTAAILPTSPNRQDRTVKATFSTKPVSKPAPVKPKPAPKIARRV